jgi:signal transduction histidine kinase
MRGGGKVAPRILGLVPGLALAGVLSYCPSAAASEPDTPKLVVVLYPHGSDGAPGILQINRAIKSIFASEAPWRIEICNEYIAAVRLRDGDFKQAQVSFLRQKYAGRKVDLVIAATSTSLDFLLEHRDELFPSVPVVFATADQREVTAHLLPPDVIGVPIRKDLDGTLDLALRLHPDTRRVFVVAGSATFDAHWESEARRTFRSYEGRLEFVYLTGLPMDELLGRVAGLPEQSIVYYIHITQDSTGKPFVAAEALERLAARANAPIYGFSETYVGRGIVGGRVFNHETEGTKAARLGLRILAGAKPETIPLPEMSENTAMFDWQQLRRWGVSEESLPPGSIVRHKEPTIWDVYKWHIVGTVSLCVVEALLIAGLLIQRGMWRRAMGSLRESRRELQLLSGRLLEAQEVERRRIARELHDDLNQSLALLSLELELLAQDPPTSAAEVADRMQELSARVKELSSAVHDLSHQLHPSRLEQLGLVTALDELCKEVAHGHDLDVKFTHHPEPGPIPPDAALCLYRIVQEALGNVVKHSGSHHALVELSGAVGSIRLRVTDDGVGFEPGTVAGSGLGLVSMRERLHLVGGQIAIDSRPAGGTRIDVRVPVAAPDRPVNGAPGGGMTESPQPRSRGNTS